MVSITIDTESLQTTHEKDGNIIKARSGQEQDYIKWHSLQFKIYKDIKKS